MSKKGNVWDDLLKPVVVLLCIALAAAALLGFVNSKTEPIIKENARIKAEQTRAAVLAGAKGFEEIKGDYAVYDIGSIYKETSGLGYVITSTHKGYGGDVKIMVGYDLNGTIVGFKVLSASDETPGLGQNSTKEDFWQRFTGKCGELKVNKYSNDGQNLQAITSATITSTAVVTAVNEANQAFTALTGVQLPDALTGGDSNG